MLKIGLRWRLIALRTKWYQKTKKLKLGEGVKILGSEEFTGGGHITIGENTRVAPWCVFREYGGHINIGKNCSINSFCHFSGNGGIDIGNNVLIATQCVLISANHKFDLIDIPICEQGETRDAITIGDDCWLGAGVKILQGVTIGEGSVIGASAVVTKDIPPFSIAVGVPAKIVRKRDTTISEDRVRTDE